jgi:hypothetical protein
MLLLYAIQILHATSRFSAGAEITHKQSTKRFVCWYYPQHCLHRLFVKNCKLAHLSAFMAAVFPHRLTELSWFRFSDVLPDHPRRNGVQCASFLPAVWPWCPLTMRPKIVCVTAGTAMSDILLVHILRRWRSQQEAKLQLCCWNNACTVLVYNEVC